MPAAFRYLSARCALGCLIAWLATAFGLDASPAFAANPDEMRFFEEQVRPILATKCFRCHGEEKQKGGLRLDSHEAIRTGGDSGPAIDLSEPGKSLLIEAINYESLEMPPDEKLGEDAIVALTKWVRMGAPWPDSGTGAVRPKTEKITDEDRSWWAFQPIKRPAEPAVDGDWARNSIDRFILQKLVAEGLHPSPAAERRVLIRRLSFDLTGLPPTPEEVEAFVNDPSANAYETIVDRLLNSPRYGERWARHWLDLVRYAETDGFKQDGYRPHSWRYRDYVIRSFNQDKPYNQFVMEQLAGDEMAPHDLDALAATAYLRHWIYEYNQRDVRTQWSNILNDVTDVTAEVFLGVSVGCARCHDHKFDPILRKDYYRLQAFFTPLLPREDVPFATAETIAEHQKKLAQWQEKTAELRRQIDELEAPIRKQVAAAAINKFPPDIRPMMSKPVDQRSPFEQQLADLAFRQVTEEYSKLDISAKLKGESKEKWQSLKKQLAAFDDQKPGQLDPALTVSDVGPVAPATYIPGDRTKQEIQPGFLTVLDPADASIPAEYSTSTGRRTALARWITRPDNPLAVRVIVNRVWQYHFGQGIVATASDFGHLGDPPSHPELLDWLSSTFVENGWSLKKLHRLIVMSATYQQAAVVETPEAAKLKDPENRWLWHMPIRRLDAEQIRDAALAVAGELELPGQGPSVGFSKPARTIFTKVIRNVRDPLLDVFDAPDNFNSTSQRNVTITPTQSLLMINGPWILDRAEAFAARLHRAHPNDPIAQAALAFQLVYGRKPSAEQQKTSVSFLNQTAVPAQVAATTPGFAPFPGRAGQALDVQPGKGLVPVAAAGEPLDLGTEFTIEATILLRSLYEDAAVRTIVSQWNSDQKQPGWSLGVTSKKSKHDPLNLILQFVGDAKDGPAYEVVASNLRLELNRPYSVAVTVRLSDVSDKGVTFYLKDLTRPDSPVLKASLPHKVLKFPRAANPVVIGGRSSNERHRWDGLIDDLRIHSSVLTADELLANRETSEKVAGVWRFEPDSGLLHDLSPHHRDLTAVSDPQPKQSAVPVALVDFCHVLLNSSEFLYVE